MGDYGRQGETRPWTHQPTQATMRQWETMGDNGRQWETMREGATRGDKGRQGLGKADTQSNTCGKTMGDKGRQDLGKADTPSNTGTHVGRQWEKSWETRGEKGRKGLGKADTPSNTGTHTGRQWDTRRDTGVGRRTHHPKGDKWRQGETRPQEGGHTIQQRKPRRGTMGNKGDKTIGKADSPSNRGKPE